MLCVCTKRVCVCNIELVCKAVWLAFSCQTIASSLPFILIAWFWQSICTSFYLSIYLPIPFVYIHTGFSKWMIRRHFIPNANITPGFLHNRVSLTFIIIIVEIKNNCLLKAGWLYHKYFFIWWFIRLRWKKAWNLIFFSKLWTRKIFGF